MSVRDQDTLGKRKRTMNPKLLDVDNMSEEAIKHRTLAASKSSHINHPPGEPPGSKASTSASSLNNRPAQSPFINSSKASSRQASVENLDDKDDIICHNAGRPKNSKHILESTDDEDDIQQDQAPGPEQKKRQKKSTTPEADEKQESDGEELGKPKNILHLDCTDYTPARLQKEWRSKVYAFFHPDVKICHVDGRKCHEFSCNARNCKGKGKNPRLVRRFLDTKDRASTKSLRVHAINCWGREIVDQSEDAKNISSAREALKGAELRDGSLTAVFERTGKGKVTYSHKNHTSTESR